MSNVFTDTSNPNLIGLWDFANGAKLKDTATAVDGEAQNGVLEGDDVSISGNALVLKDDNDESFFKVIGDGNGPKSSAFDLNAATVQVRFVQSDHNGGSEDVLISRGAFDEKTSDGYFQIAVEKNGKVTVWHQMPNGVGPTLRLETPSDVFDEGDDVEVFYSFDGAKGVLKVINHTRGTTTDEQLTNITDLSFAIGGDDEGEFIFGARAKEDDDYHKEFSGEIAYVAIYNSFDITGVVSGPSGGDGIVEGTDSADLIDTSYTDDPDGDQIDNNDGINGTSGDQDFVLAGDGNDTVLTGAADDIAFGEGGDDTIEGGEGDDVLIGDALGATAPNTIVRESFSWDELGLSDGQTIGNFSQNTGNVTTSFTILNSSNGVRNEFSDEDQRVAGIDNGGDPVNDNSAFLSILGDPNRSADYELRFSQPVSDVQFRLNDIDGDGQVKVTAFDAAGNQINVNIAGGAQLTLSDTDSQIGDDTAASQGGYADPDSALYSLKVDVPGDVVRIEIAHDQFNNAASGITITDVSYNVEVASDDVAKPNLITNGSFEDTTGMAMTPFGFSGSEAPGWQTVPATDDLDVYSTARDGLQSTDGSNWAQMSQGGTAGFVFQDVPNIDPNSQYVLRFDAGDYAGDNNGIEVFWNGELVKTIAPADIPAGSWSKIELVLNGNSGDASGRLAFGGTGPDDNVGASIDSVELYQVDPSQGDGDDTLVGGIGDDILLGGAGNDTFELGSGEDAAFGGDDADTFRDVDARDFIDGGEGGNDFDTLDLTNGGRLSVVFDAPGSENGTVRFLEDDGTLKGTARFVNIENVIPCFTPEALVETATGLRRAEDLRAGDRVLTRDNGFQEIRWACASPLTASELSRRPHLRPVRIRAGALGGGLPERDMLVSPNHRMLISGPETALYFAEPEVLVAAKFLVNGTGVTRVEVGAVNYIHFMFDRHEVVRADGAWSESFQPGDYTLAAIDQDQRQEILALFPDLASVEGLDAYHAARLSLRRSEAQLLRA